MAAVDREQLWRHLELTKTQVARLTGLSGMGHVHVLMRHQVGTAEWPEVVRQGVDYCSRHELGVLAVDTFDRWTGLYGDTENTAGAVNEAMVPFHAAAAAGLAVLVNGHQRKSAGRCLMPRRGHEVSEIPDAVR